MSPAPKPQHRTLVRPRGLSSDTDQRCPMMLHTGVTVSENADEAVDAYTTTYTQDMSRRIEGIEREGHVEW